MKQIGEYLISKEFLETLLLVVIMFALLVIIKKYLIKRVAYKTYSKNDQKVNSLIGVVFNILQYLVVLVTLFAILSIHGVNVTGMLAGIGVVATIVGLSLQDTLKDIINGINIYNNNFYKVNDLVKYNGELCEVKYFNARITKFKSLYTNSTYTVPNSSITSMEKVKDMTCIFVTFKFEADHDKIMKAFKKAGEEMMKLGWIKKVIPAGCVEIGTIGNKYIFVVMADPRDYFMGCTAIYEILIKQLKKHHLKPVNLDFPVSK